MNQYVSSNPLTIAKNWREDSSNWPNHLGHMRSAKILAISFPTLCDCHNEPSYLYCHLLFRGPPPTADIICICLPFAKSSDICTLFNLALFSLLRPNLSLLHSCLTLRGEIIHACWQKSKPQLQSRHPHEIFMVEGFFESCAYNPFMWYFSNLYIWHLVHLQQLFHKPPSLQ